MDHKVLLKGESLVKRFGGMIAVNDVAFEVHSGEMLAVIGPNGAGKSVLFSPHRDVSLEIAAGSCVALLGSNGAGKSILFRTIAGLVAPVAGTITLKGRTISHLPADRIVRRGLALCPEGRQLFPGLTVHKNLMLGAHTVKDRKSALMWAMELKGPGTTTVSLLPMSVMRGVLVKASTRNSCPGSSLMRIMAALVPKTALNTAMAPLDLKRRALFTAWVGSARSSSRSRLKV